MLVIVISYVIIILITTYLLCIITMLVAIHPRPAQLRDTLTWHIWLIVMTLRHMTFCLVYDILTHCGILYSYFYTLNNYTTFTRQIRYSFDNIYVKQLTMKRLTYIQQLTLFLQKNPEILLQQLLPTSLLEEIYNFQRFQYKLLQT